MFSDISKKLSDAKKKVLILTHRKEIFEQTFKKLCDYGISPGQIRSDKDITRDNIQVGMIQTVHNRLKKQERLKAKFNFKKFDIVQKPDLIIIDECFLPGTKITTVNGNKNIEEINNNDLVLTLNESRKCVEYKKVKKLIKKITNKKILEINNNILCTEDHLIYTKRGWIKAKNLKIGVDMMLRNMSTFFLKWVIVENIQIQKHRGMHEKNNGLYVYDLTIKDNHNYFANNILVHNCHHSTSKTWKEVLDYFKDVPQIGFTATPERLDGSGLIDLFDTLIVGKSTKWMVYNYWLAKPIHLCPPSPLEKENIKMYMGDYDKKAQSEIMKRHVVCADVVKSYRQYFNGAPIITFCVTIEHAKQMDLAYKSDGWRSIVIHGKMNTSDRDDAMNGFRDGKYQILISVNLIGEGVDVPACAGIQVLRKTKSLSLYLQMFARGLTPIYADGYNLEDKNERKKALQKGKPESLILDHAGNYWIHGSILKERDWSIDHKKRDGKKKIMIEKKTCPECLFDWDIDMKVCPNCGHNFETEVKAKKEFEMFELKKELIDVNQIEEVEAESLSKTILRIKEYKNSKNAMLAILHNSIKYGECNIQNKISAFCNGLGYDKKYKHRVWRHLREQYGERLDKLA